MEPEEWKDVLGYEGLYEVSSMGRVRSLKRFIKTRNRTYGGKILKQNTVSGYKAICICKNNIKKTFLVHFLVLTSFVGQRKDGFQCCHNNGNRIDNNLANLRWDTTKANHADKHKHGTALLGTKHHQCKLTEHEVLEIRKMASDGLKITKIANTFNVSRKNIRCIASRMTWKHI